MDNIKNRLDKELENLTISREFKDKVFSGIKNRRNNYPMSADILILEILSRKPMYGFEILCRIQERGEEEEIFGHDEGTLYAILYNMVNKKLLKMYRKEIQGKERTFFEITLLGKAELDVKQKNVEKKSELQKLPGGI